MSLAAQHLVIYYGLAALTEVAALAAEYGIYVKLVVSN